MKKSKKDNVKLFTKIFNENTWMFPPTKVGKQKVNSVGITVNNQKFQIDTGRGDDKLSVSEANWFRNQLTHALVNLIDENSQ